MVITGLTADVDTSTACMALAAADFRLNQRTLS
jgi:hypothetical protein